MRMGKLSEITAEKTLRAAIDAAYLADEYKLLHALANNRDPLQFSQMHQQAFRLVERSRELHTSPHLSSFLNEFSLSSDEGIVLMCLAEALLRIPDSATQSRLIHDKLSSADWWSHIGHSPSLLVNASAWGLLLTGSVLRPDYICPTQSWAVSKSHVQPLRCALNSQRTATGYAVISGTICCRRNAQ